MFLHVFNTWLIANLLHPLLVFLFSVLFFFDGASVPVFNGEMIEIMLYVLAFSLLLSLPCLLVATLCFCHIADMKYTVTSRFVCWLFAATGSVFFCLWGLILLFDIAAFQTIIYALPAIAATGIAVLIRYRQFVKIISPEIIEYETDC